MTTLKSAMLKANDGATYLSLGLREIRRLVKAGELDVKYIGEHSAREYRILTASADAYVESLPSDPTAA